MVQYPCCLDLAARTPRSLHLLTQDHNTVQGVEPVLRTYNTLMICNNMCHQPRETMAVYKQMQDEGFTPNATTYNALISAYGKAGQLDKVLSLLLSLSESCISYP